MGVEIHLIMVPDRVSAEAWSAVYRESLILLRQFPFLERKSDGRGHFYAQWSAHQEDIWKGYGGWCVEGDMRTGPNMESFYLMEDIGYYRNELQHAADNGHDIMMAELGDEAPLESPAYACVWGAKTQGQLAHDYLLAIGCLICHRLKNAAHIFGDITAAQCRTAIQWANRFLDKPIDVPVTADQSRLLNRLTASGLEGETLLSTFFRLTLEAPFGHMGDFLKEQVSVKAISDYYKKELQPYRREPDQLYLDQRSLKKYLQLGLDFQALCRLVMADPDGNQLTPREFMKVLLEMKLHIPTEEKVLHDFGSSPKEMENGGVDSVNRQLFGIWCTMYGARNRNVAAYRPLTEICGDFAAVLGDGEYMAMAEELLAEIEGSKASQNQSAIYDGPDSLYAQLTRKAEKDELGEYDITDRDDIIDFRCGDVVAPKLHDTLLDYMKQLREIGTETFIKNVEPLNEEQRRAWFWDSYCVLIPQNIEEYFFSRIMDNDYIVRYVALYSVEVTEGILWVIRAFLWNRELLDHYWELTEEGENGHEKTVDDILTT